MVIVDTSVWIDYLRGVESFQTNWLDGQMGNTSIGLTDLILCEVLQGIRGNAKFNEIHDELTDRFNVFNSGGSHIAAAAARNYRALMARGFTTRKTIDCVIATFCIEADFELLHNDRDFEAFESELGLRVIHA